MLGMDSGVKSFGLCSPERIRLFPYCTIPATLYIFGAIQHPTHEIQDFWKQVLNRYKKNDVKFDLCITDSLSMPYSKSHAQKFPHKSALKRESDECGGKLENDFFLLSCKSYLVWQAGELLLYLQ